MGRAEGMLHTLPEGSYHVSYYDRAQKRMESVGRDATEALSQVRRNNCKLSTLLKGWLPIAESYQFCQSRNKFHIH